MRGTPRFMASGLLAGLAVAGAMLGIAADGADMPVTVTLTEQSGTEQSGGVNRVSLVAGQSFAIELASNVSTGFTWEVKEPLPAGVILSSSGRVSGSPPDAGSEPMVGLSDRQRFVFKAQAQGRGDIVLVYRRPWEKNDAPAKIFKVTLDVK